MITIAQGHHFCHSVEKMWMTKFLDFIIKINVNGFFATDSNKVIWHLSIHEVNGVGPIVFNV